jgi:tRNA-2-methylthio-N6-dimethylallyladenosine synthase
MGPILSEIRQLASEGYQEILLLGQTVNSWRDPAGEIPSFAELLRRVADIEGIRRIRFTSPHPSDFHPEIIEVIETVPAVCNKVHLPVQSGSTSVLQRMKRDYTRQEYLRRVELIKTAKREIALSTDIIVGFPGESQEDFEETLSLMEQVQYDSIFSFQSTRPGQEQRLIPSKMGSPRRKRAGACWFCRNFSGRFSLKGMCVLSRSSKSCGRKEPGRQDLMGRTTQNKIVNFSVRLSCWVSGPKCVSRASLPTFAEASWSPDFGRTQEAQAELNQPWRRSCRTNGLFCFSFVSDTLENLQILRESGTCSEGDLWKSK